MTPSERERWLRDRGVRIETPSDRRKVESVLSGDGDGRRPPSVAEQIRRLSLNSAANDDAANAEGEGIKFVYLPHDSSRPMSTIVLPRRVAAALGPAGDVLPTYVKSFFADDKAIDETLFAEQAAKQNLVGGEVGEEAAARLTSTALASAAAGGSVETFPLVRPSSTNGNEGVYIYLDEVGLLKRLPNNKRASDLARRCGYDPAPNFYGDVFVGRVSSKEFLRNVDIAKEDVMDTAREWMVRAPQENLAWQQTVNEVTGRKGETQPSHAGTEGVPVRVDAGDDDERCSFSWTQNDEEVEIAVSLSETLAAGEKPDKASVKARFKSQGVRVEYGSRTMLDLRLYSKLDVDGCTWTLEGETLVVTCEKASEGEIWPRLELSG
ncbi:hypothetical protein ACHAWF_006809 [Thalassiosira exigua]